ncbi:hypothetical protein RFI_07265 [Reticulomyxa filosa]|uniref:Uncharacterized protein n=1 Tax=Reticulomyxa filosa TaxID=46433 RepID=X6NV24_RETFI|nr:hypothetical protein RFI_07265 [Reticulomyxa filosa]|eukprot:ETO29856.1 hypothetical protein RFI_07265 [Reticulomyxa filosa]
MIFPILILIIQMYHSPYVTVHEAAQLGDVTQLKSALENHSMNINNSLNEYGQTPLHLAINNRHWKAARYCIEQGAWIDFREGAIDAITSHTPLEYIMEFIQKEKHKENEKEYLEMKEMCKWILKKRTMYPMKQIEYSIDYVKDKLIDGDGVTKVVDEESYEILLQEGASFLLGINQKDLQEILINGSSLYWAARRNIKAIEFENSNQKRFDEGWDPRRFLICRIFLLFEICVRLKREGKNYIGLPRQITLKQVYEKGIQELQVQLTTYWDYITTQEFQYKFSYLIDDWSENVVDRLMDLQPTSSNECCEMSLVVGHDGHCIYLSLCKTVDAIVIRIDNRWMNTVPSKTLHPKIVSINNDNNSELIQPYIVSYFRWNTANINEYKKWLINYVKIATKLRDSDNNVSMKHLYWCDQPSHNISPCNKDISSIIKNWPYRPVQTDANNCYLRSHNVGYRIRLGNTLYEWFRKQEGKSFVFNQRRDHQQKSGYENMVNEPLNKVMGKKSSNVSSSSPLVDIPSHVELMKLLSKQLKVPHDEVLNGIAVEQSLVSKAKIDKIQKGAYFRRDALTNHTYFQLCLNLSERSYFYQFYNSQFPKLIQHFKDIDQNWVQFYFDTNIFHCQVLPSLLPLT